jgi:hypothetical protein
LSGASAVKRAGPTTGNQAGDFKKSLRHFQSLPATESDLTPGYDCMQSLAEQLALALVSEVLEVSRTAYYRYLRGATYRPTPLKEKQLKLVKEMITNVGMAAGA